MPGICAACNEAIGDGDQFALAGTEVFHRRCVGGIENSHRTRLEQQLIRAKREHLALRSNLAAAKRHADDNDAMIQKLTRRQDDLEKRWREQETELESLRSLNGDYNRLLAQYRDLQRDLRVANEATERVSAQLRNVQLQALRQPSSEPVESTKVDTRDPTEVRFSLLEIER